MERIILHSDLNNFYASVECLYDPSIREKPVAVGGSTELRHGIILAKNYIAKKYGIQTGETIWQAKQKCPDLITLSPNFQRYMRFSQLVRDIYADYTDRIESFGLDECWLDVSGSGIFGDGEKIANEIRKRITFELGVTVSVGVSYNKIFAKLGSDLKKPDATTIISKDNYKQIVWPLPVNELLYVGRSTYKKLRKYSIRTIGDLANSDVAFLKRRLGKNGYTLWVFANGWDDSIVSDMHARPYIKSIGNSTTTPRDLMNDNDVWLTMNVLSESVGARLRKHNFKCSTVQITLRDKDLFSFQRQGALPYDTFVSKNILEKAFQLYKANYHSDKPLRSIGIRACNLRTSTHSQLSLIPEIRARQIREDLEYTIDDLRRRYGYHGIKKGVMLTDRNLTALDAQKENTIHPVSFFRNSIEP